MPPAEPLPPGRRTGGRGLGPGPSCLDRRWDGHDANSDREQSRTRRSNTNLNLSE